MESLWNKRRARFEALRLALTAEETWGPLKQTSVAESAWDYISRNANNQDAYAANKAAAVAAHEAYLERHMDLVWGPLCDAGMALVRTPAPDLEALRFKQSVMSDCMDLANLEDEEGELFALFMADVTRLAGEAAE